MSEQREQTRSGFVEALWLLALDLLFLPNTEIILHVSVEELFEVGPSVLADVQKNSVRGARKVVCRNQNSGSAAGDFCSHISRLLFHRLANCLGFIYIYKCLHSIF